MWQGPVRQ